MVGDSGRGLKVNRKALVLLPLMLLTIISSNALMLVSARAQVKTYDFRFRGLAVGQCIVAYGGIGPGVPDPLKWSGLGDGHATVNGHAPDATPFSSGGSDLYISENIKAEGAITADWMEADGRKHHLTAVIYSIDASEGLFSPSSDHFELSIPEYSTPERFIMFKGVYVDGSKPASIGGIAIFSGGLVGPAPDCIAVWLVDVKSGTLFFIGWSRLGTPTPFPPNYVPAAKVYDTIVQ